MADGGRDVAALAGLAEPLRGRLYTFVRQQPGPVTREQAAAALGISRKLAAFHLDKLVALGMLSVAAQPERPRRAGRSPKGYAAAAGEWQVSVPPRQYTLLARIVTDALAAAGATGRAAAERVAADTGRRLADEVAQNRPRGRLGPERALSVAAAALDELGYEPCRTTSALELGNCPFRRVVERHPELVCRVNLGLTTGLLEGLRASPPLHARLVTPQGGGCCIRVEPGGTSAGRTPRSSG